MENIKKINSNNPVLKDLNIKENNTHKSINAKWSKEHEQLLISWAEKASGYAWMHNKSVGINKKYNLYISVPASIFGYIAGTTTLLMETETIWMRGFIGITGILAGILSNFQQMFTFKELSEQHRISCLRFLAFFRDISSELSISIEHRTNPIDYITMKRMEMDIMLEQSPTIPDCIIRLFNEKTKHIGKTFHKPEVTNILQTIIPFGSLNNIINDRDIKKSNIYKKFEEIHNNKEKKDKYEKLYLLDIYFTKWKYIKKYNNRIKNLDEFKNNMYNDDNDMIDVEIANSHIDKSEVRSKISHNSKFTLTNRILNSREEYITDGTMTYDSDDETDNNKSSIDKISDKINVIRENMNIFIDENVINSKNIKI